MERYPGMDEENDYLLIDRCYKETSLVEVILKTVH